MARPVDEPETTARIRIDTLLQQQRAAAHHAGATLTCLSQPRLGMVFNLNRGKTVIGRSEDADVHLAVAAVSRRHALVTEQDGTYILTDLGSTNGTYCRGQKVDGPVVLRSRDTVELGDKVVLRFALRDILEERMRAELYARATRDPLTCAPNREYFDERLDSEWPWATRHRRSCALLMLDLDHFKRINDEWGHPAGDRVLCEFVRIIQAELRREDLCGRLGGEEFAVLCRSTEAEGAAAVAERLRERVEQHEFTWHDERLPVTVSIGIALSSETDISTIDQLKQRADERLYEAKRNGRNRVVSVPVEPAPHR